MRNGSPSFFRTDAWMPVSCPLRQCANCVCCCVTGCRCWSNATRCITRSATFSKPPVSSSLRWSPICWAFPADASVDACRFHGDLRDLELFEPGTHPDQIVPEGSVSLANRLAFAAYRRQYANYDRVFVDIHAARTAVNWLHSSPPAAGRRTLARNWSFLTGLPTWWQEPHCSVPLTRSRPHSHTASHCQTVLSLNRPGHRTNVPPLCARFHPPLWQSVAAAMFHSLQLLTSISSLFKHFQIRKVGIGRLPCYTGVEERFCAPLSVPTPRRAPPQALGATQRECTTRLRHKTLRDLHKSQKEDGLYVYEEFARISQLASPTAARCNPGQRPMVSLAPRHARPRAHAPPGKPRQPAWYNSI